MLCLRAAGSEGGVEGRKDGADAPPEHVRGDARGVPSKMFGQRGLDVDANVIGVPERRVQACGTATASRDRCCCEIRGMRFEHVGPLGSNALANPVDPVQQVIGTIVRECGAREANETRSAARGDLAAYEGVVIVGSRGDDAVAAVVLGEEATPIRQMAPNSSAPLRIELGDVHDLQARSLVAARMRGDGRRHAARP